MTDFKSQLDRLETLIKRLEQATMPADSPAVKASANNKLSLKLTAYIRASWSAYKLPIEYHDISRRFARTANRHGIDLLDFIGQLCTDKILYAVRRLNSTLVFLPYEAAQKLDPAQLELIQTYKVSPRLIESAAAYKSQNRLYEKRSHEYKTALENALVQINEHTIDFSSGLAQASTGCSSSVESSPSEFKPFSEIDPEPLPDETHDETETTKEPLE